MKKAERKQEDSNKSALTKIIIYSYYDKYKNNDYDDQSLIEIPYPSNIFYI